MHPVATSAIHSFIHLENLYSAPSRKLLRGASSPITVKKISFKQLVEQRCVALWYTNRICEGSEFQIEGATTENARRCIVEVFTRGTKSLSPEEERSA